MNTSTSRDRLWRKRLNELSAVWPDFLSGRTGGLHKTRVASRRIREALPIIGATAPPAKVKKLNKRMRALTRSLGPIRELDVELAILENKSRTEGVPGRALEIVRRDAASRRQALRDELADHAPISDLKKLLKKLERVGTAGQKAEGKGKKGGKQAADVRFEAQWRGVLATRLMRRAKSVATALENAGPVYAPERLHQVRISTKKLRYALEIARDAGVSAAMPLVRVLKRHQERLGGLHDLQMLLKHVREAEASPGVGSRVNDLTAYAESLDRECRRLHAGFVEHRAELAAAVKDVRHHVVPALATPPRRQAHVTASRPAVRPRRVKP
jgi:CHAD domain-containing protein